MSVLRCQASAAMTTIDPYSIHIDGIAQLYKKNKKNQIILHAV